MKMEITTTTVRIIGVIIEAIGPIGANIITGDHIGGLSTGEWDNKITIEANFKATAGNLILFMVAIIIITTVIIMAEQASGPPFIRKSATCRIMQDGKDPIITTDFYLTNMEPREWILPAPLTNYKGAATNSAAAACNLPPEIPADPLQPGKI